MTQPDLLTAIPETKRLSLTDRLASYFKACPDRAIPVRELAQIAGIGGWRSRLAELRFAPYAMRIENTQRVDRLPDGSHRRHSFYRYIPEAQ